MKKELFTYSHVSFGFGEDGKQLIQIFTPEVKVGEYDPQTNSWKISDQQALNRVGEQISEAKKICRACPAFKSRKCNPQIMRYGNTDGEMFIITQVEDPQVNHPAGIVGRCSLVTGGKYLERV